VRALHVPETAESLGRNRAASFGSGRTRWSMPAPTPWWDTARTCLRGIEFYRGRPIAYSLGNFLTYRGFNLEGPLGVTGVLQLEFAPDRRLRRARLVPMAQRPGEGPAPDSAGTALELVRRLSAEDFGASAASVSEYGDIGPPP
jgi:Bacterial capsule synthesis protein PGA_cap.